MDEEFKQNINNLAEEIRKQARDLKIDTFLSFLFTSDIIDKYLDIQLRDQPITRAGFSVLHQLILNDGIMIPTELSSSP